MQLTRNLRELVTYYPFRFQSIVKEKPWGGRALETVLGKKLPPNTRVGESWEVSVRGEDASIISGGRHSGTSLRQLLELDRAAILGAEIAQQYPNRFPLLVKYIDAEDILSLQVHPDDEYAAAYENGEWGKTEAWYIIHAEDGASVVRGTVPGIDRETFLKKLEDGTVNEILNHITVRPGDVIYMPAGCLHATGAGILLAEIQQNSDLTYRVYDWGRAGLDGKPRELHLEKALDVIDWGLVEREGHGEHHVIPGKPGPAQPLLKCPKFEIERCTLRIGETSESNVSRRFHILCIIEGSGKIICPQETLGPVSFRKGDTFLIPAALGSYELAADEHCTALRAYLPVSGL